MLKNRLPTLFLSLLAVLTVVSVLGRIYVANELSVKGQEISRIRREISEIELENSILKAKISHASSLNQIKELAMARGFRPAEEIEFLRTPVTASITKDTL